ncbi:hypothetical protein FDECE_12195 [Fusarium decemcellulare]|nr:hypothetical protein FDECE_12195 [Fusarium decemcellulare]
MAMPSPKRLAGATLRRPIFSLQSLDDAASTIPLLPLIHIHPKIHLPHRRPPIADRLAVSSRPIPPFLPRRPPPSSSSFWAAFRVNEQP